MRDRELSFPFHRVGYFIKRLNRFQILLSMEKERTKAYLPNPGRLEEILLPKRKIYLMENPLKSGKYTVIAAEKEGIPILLHTHYTNKVVSFLLKEKALPFFKEYEIKKEEVRWGNSRFDFLLSKGKEEFFLEVKSCTLFGQRVALFPDAKTERGSRHLFLLSSLKKIRKNAGIIFVVHNPHILFFMPEYHIDPLFSKRLLEARREILVKAFSIGWRIEKDQIKLLPEIKELSIPWEFIEKEAKDRGLYLLILWLERETSIFTRKKEWKLKKGYYIYVGSAKRHLEKRIRRHLKTKKPLFWHIDYLREKAQVLRAIPIRTETLSECELAKKLKEIELSPIHGFGSSDCNCQSHLFFTKEQPLNSERFVKLLEYLKTDRLLDFLDSH